MSARAGPASRRQRFQSYVFGKDGTSGVELQIHPILPTLPYKEFPLTGAPPSGYVLQVNATGRRRLACRRWLQPWQQPGTYGGGNPSIQARPAKLRPYRAKPCSGLSANQSGRRKLLIASVPEVRVAPLHHRSTALSQRQAFGRQGAALVGQLDHFLEEVDLRGRAEPRPCAKVLALGVLKGAAWRSVRSGHHGCAAACRCHPSHQGGHFRASSGSGGRCWRQGPGRRPDLLARHPSRGPQKQWVR